MEICFASASPLVFFRLLVKLVQVLDSLAHGGPSLAEVVSSGLLLNHVELAVAMRALLCLVLSETIAEAAPSPVLVEGALEARSIA